MRIDFNLDEALRDGLRRLPLPEISPDFDMAVLEAVRRPLPLWTVFLTAARPVFAGMCCSLIVTVLAVGWTLRSPYISTVPRTPSDTLSHIDLAALDRAIDSRNLRADTLLRLALDASPSVDSSNPADRRVIPIRHALRPYHSLVA